jgi:hypothetical protein
MRYRGILAALLTSLLAGACGAKHTVFHHDDPNDPLRVTKTEIAEKSFFESENLVAHYSAMQNQTNALLALHKENKYATDAEKVMGGVITALLVEKVSSMPMPRTMADVFNANLTSWLSLGLQAYAIIDDGGGSRRTGSPNLSIEGDNNSLLFDSQLGNGPGSRASFYFGDYSEIDADSNGHGSYLNLDVSRQYTYETDQSITNTRTYVDSPQDNDRSLF